jgi:uncharacterized protein with von Willebrand factor type A (vWA) domain
MSKPLTAAEMDTMKNLAELNNRGETLATENVALLVALEARYDACGSEAAPAPTPPGPSMAGVMATPAKDGPLDDAEFERLEALDDMYDADPSSLTAEEKDERIALDARLAEHGRARWAAVPAAPEPLLTEEEEKRRKLLQRLVIGGIASDEERDELVALEVKATPPPVPDAPDDAADATPSWFGKDPADMDADELKAFTEYQEKMAAALEERRKLVERLRAENEARVAADKDLVAKAAGIGGTDDDLSAVEITDDPTVLASKTSRPRVVSDTALELLMWDKQKGQQIVREVPALADKLGVSPVGAGLAAADLYASVFLPDAELVATAECKDEVMQRFVGGLLESPDFKQLRTSTVLDPEASEIAMAGFSESYHQMVVKVKAGQCKKPAGGAPDLGAMSAAASAVRAAAKGVEEYDDMRGGLANPAGGGIDPKVAAAMFKKVRGNKALQRILQLAGKFRRVAATQQRLKTSHGMDDMIGITTGGNIERLLPMELAELADDDDLIGTLAYKRLMEGQSMMREHHAVKAVGKGPVVVCVDESGSMSGEKVYTAKALALALVWVAMKQKRWCCLIAYSGDTGHRIVTLKPHAVWDTQGMVTWLADFLGGGSSHDIPLRELPDWWDDTIKPPKGKTDCVMVTDAEAHFTDQHFKKWNDFRRREQMRAVGLIVNNDGDALKPGFDEIHRVKSIDVDSPEIQSVLSI